MVSDVLGFMYPKIDLTKCVDCGLCNKVCVLDNDYNKEHLIHQKAYTIRHKSDVEVKTSRSGAAFSAIANHILSIGGVVYGVCLDEYFMAIHERAMSKEEVNRFKGSKYIQSNLNDIFQKVKMDLADGKTVLFSGTPCQVGGLIHTLSKKLMTNLYTIDLICHGVGSPSIWKDFLRKVEQKYNVPIISANFRDKSYRGWDAHFESFMFANGKVTYGRGFANIYYRKLITRQSCFNCKFTNFERPSDITLGDDWITYRQKSNFNNDNKGRTIVIVNSVKGEEIFNNIQETVNYCELPLASLNHPNLYHPTNGHKDRLLFEKIYTESGFDAVWKKFGHDFWGLWFIEIYNKIFKQHK